MEGLKYNCSFTGIKFDKIGRKCFIWKGKSVKEKVYYHKLKLSKSIKSAKKIWMNKTNEIESSSSVSNTNANDKKNHTFVDIEGRRIMHVKTIASQLICRNCKAILSLLHTIEEKKIGLASIFYVQCQHCLTPNAVSTDKKHDTPTKRQHYDINTLITMCK